MEQNKYFKLYIQIKNDITEGKYSPGTKLPSKRLMAEKSGYSLITVEHTYSMLADEGYINPIEKKGYFVSDIVFPNYSECETGQAFSRLPEPTEYSNQQFEYSTWFRTVRKVIAENERRLFIKSPNKGCEVLRNAISDYLMRYRGIVADPHNIIIGSGAEQLYETAVKLMGLGKIYGIEDPCYKQIEYVYSSLELSLCKLKMGNDGIESSELVSKVFDVLHVTPFHSFPTGVNTSIAKKLEYIKWVAENDRFIIEDDFDSEFFIPIMPVQSLYSLDKTKSTVYINTFSKSLSPAMRIGYMIIPEKLMKKYEEKLGKLSCSVPVMDQYVLAEFISSGGFERHLNRMRRKTLKKSDSDTEKLE